MLVWYGGGAMRTSSHTPPSIVTEAATFIGIDYHKRYSVWHAVDAAGSDLGNVPDRASLTACLFDTSEALETGPGAK